MLKKTLLILHNESHACERDEKRFAELHGFRCHNPFHARETNADGACKKDIACKAERITRNDQKIEPEKKSGVSRVIVKCPHWLHTHR
jgi:hypothetical protein